MKTNNIIPFPVERTSNYISKAHRDIIKLCQANAITYYEYLDLAEGLGVNIKAVNWKRQY